MPNIIADGTSKQHWMPNAQRAARKRAVARSIATVYTGPDRIIHNPYGNMPAKSDGVAATSYAVTDFTLFDDTMTVNRRATAAEHIDNIEQLQVRYDLSKNRAELQGYTVADAVDQYLLSLPSIVSGVTTLDGGAFGGTGGQAFGVTNSNVDEVANAIATNLMLGNAADAGLFWAVSPYEVSDIVSFSQGTGVDYANAYLRNGFTGVNFGGLDIIVTNNLPHATTLGLATNPTAGDTLTVNGVIFTFVSALGVAPGNVLIAGSADLTRANLEAAINGGAGAGSAYVELTERNRRKFDHANLAAANNNASDTLALTANQTLTVSETLTAGGDTFSAVTRRTVAGIKGSIFAAIPEDGFEFEKTKVGGKHGREVETSQIYNGTIWEETKNSIFSVHIS